MADDRHRRPLADRGSPGRTHGNAVTNPRIRVCSTVVLTALPPAPRTRSILLQPVPDNGIAHPRPTSLTTNIRVSARQLVVEPRVRLLPRHRRSLLRRVEPASSTSLGSSCPSASGTGPMHDDQRGLVFEASWTALLARVVTTGKIKPQCSQILEEGGQNERLVASGRMLRSTTLESISTRPSARNRHKPVHRERA